jgi:hypothetical protein
LTGAATSAPTVPRSGWNERDDAAAESAAGHPGAERTSAPGRLDGETDGGDGDFEVVTHGGMGGVEERRQVRHLPFP